MDTAGRKFAKRSDDTVMPAMFNHCTRTYQAMFDEARALPNESTGGNVIIYEGFFVSLVTQQLALSVPYYGTIRRALIDMGCIRQLRRGGGASPSQWELITEPTEEMYREYEVASNIKDKQPTKLALTNERVTRLEVTVSQLQTSVEAINEFLAGKFGLEE